VAAIGVSPWTVLAQGIAHITGWTIGFATLMTGLFVLICWLPLKQTPGIGIVLNILIIASVLDFLLPYIPNFESSFFSFLVTIFGVILTGFGGAVYLISNLGPGPRDGLMTGLQRITDFPIAWVRSAIELTAICIGWSLGGNLGIGTVLFALGIGPSTAASMYFLQSIFGKIKVGV
jgi:hypothetical protein